jgi:hypothetical protein
MTPDGCVFRACSGGEVLDVVSGACVAPPGIAGLLPAAPAARGPGLEVCPPPLAPVVSEGRLACLAPEAQCPRGTRLDGNQCVRPNPCPPGALADETTRASCRPVVTQGPDSQRSGFGHGGSESHVVDVGAWAALVLGADGGPGSPELCRPLAQQPDAFTSLRAALDASKGGSAALRLRISLTLPDQDVTRVHAQVEVALEPEAPHRSAGASPPPSSAGPAAQPAQAAAEEAVGTLLEPLRGLGGEGNAREVKVEVRCELVLR